jgi:hypothetical protein
MSTTELITRGGRGLAKTSDARQGPEPDGAADAPAPS